jgi:hypothetical protein
MDIDEDPLWKRDIYLAGISRILDIQNYDFVKQTIKSQGSFIHLISLFLGFRSHD